jgi:hypothetical protein
MEVDIFEWWRINGSQFPDLTKMARIFHSIPATSISSERLFSKAGLIFADSLRNRFKILIKLISILRLSAAMLEKILVIKTNLDTVYLAPSIELDPEEICSD